MEASKFNQYEQKANETIYAEPEDTFHRKMIPQMVASFIPQFELKENDLILDIGCGPGIFLQEMKDLHYKSVIGVTLSNEDIDICEKKNLKVVRSSMSDLAFDDNSVDFIWCRHALEHSPYPLFTLFEFNRVLKNGGKAYIEVPMPDSVRPHEQNPNHYSILGNNMWNSLFIKAGFKILFNNYLDLNLTIDGKEVPERYIIYGIEKCDKLFQSKNSNE